jgi:hypothetical protein
VTLSGTKPFATLVAEMVSKIGTGKDADDTVVVRGGFRYAPARAVILDCAVGVGLTSASPDWSPPRGSA